MEKKKIKEDENKKDKPSGKEKEASGKTSGEHEISEEEKQKQNQQIKNIFIAIAGIILIFLLIYLVISSAGNFEYRGVKFKAVKEGNLLFYNTVIPVKSITGNSVVSYNFYLRNDPRKVDKEVAFNGEISFKKNIVLNSTSSFHCDGDGVIAVANFVNLLKQAGAEVIQDKNATCDSQGRYTYILLQEANTTSVEQIGLSCYNININNCEILKGTERFMNEIFVKLKK